MPRKVDTAYVEYLPDFSSFVRETNRQLSTVFKDVEKISEKAAKDVEEVFSEAGDQVENTFKELDKSAAQSLHDVSRSVSATAEDMAQEMQHGGERAEDAFDELERKARSELKKVDREVQKTAAKTGEHFKKAGLVVGAAMTGAVLAIGAALGTLATFGLKSAAELEQVQISFNSLLGGVEEGTKVFKDLQKFAALTPFEFPTVADAAKKFLAFAGSVGMTRDQLQDYLTTIGNVISVTGGGQVAFDSIGMAIGQIGSVGKLTLDNLNQIAEAIPGFSPIAAIAKSLGTTTATAMEMISAGSISAQQGVAAILKGMREFPGAAGAMEAQSQTLLGVWSTFKDVMSQTLADAFKPAIPAIKDSLTQLTPVIGEALGKLAPSIGKIISSALPLLGDLLQAIVPMITPILDGITTVFEGMKPALAPLGEALGQILKALEPIWPVLGDIIVQLAQALTPVALALAPVIADLAKPIADLLIALTPLLAPLGQLVAALILVLEPVIKIGEAFLSFLIINEVVPMVDALVTVINYLLGPLKDLYEFLRDIDWGAVGDAIGDALSSVGDFFVDLGKWFADLPGKIGDALAALPGVLVDAIGMLFDLAMEAIGIGIGLVIYAFTDMPGDILDALSELPSMIGDFFSDLWNDTTDTTESALDSVVSFISKIPGRVLSAISALPGILGRFFSNAFDKGKTIASNAIDKIVEFFRKLPSRLAGFASSVASGITGFIKSFINRAIDGINTGIAKVDAWVPGDLPRLPRLAHGGVAFGPALIGEDPGTAPEAAIPLGDSRALAMLRDALGTGGPSVTVAQGAIVVNVSGDVSPEKARKVGATIADEITSRLSSARNIRTGVRMA